MSYASVGGMGADIVDSMTAMSTKSIWGNLGDMTKNIVNSLVLKVPDIATSTLTSLVQSKLADKFGPDPAKSSSGGTRTVVQERVIEKQVPGATQYITMGTDWKKYLPFIVGGLAVLGGVGYLASRRRGRR